MEITDLPNEVLLLIFENMDVQDLLDASQVCVRWRDMIQCSKSLWYNINLNLDSDDDHFDLCVLFLRWLMLSPALNELTVRYDMLYFMIPVLVYFNKGDHFEYIGPKTISIRRLCVTKEFPEPGDFNVRQAVFSRIHEKWGVKLEFKCETVDMPKRIDDPEERINYLLIFNICLRLNQIIVSIEFTKEEIRIKKIKAHMNEMKSIVQDMIELETEYWKVDSHKCQLHRFFAWTKLITEMLDNLNFDKQENILNRNNVEMKKLAVAVNDLRKRGKLDMKMKGIQLMIDMWKMEIEDSKKKVDELKALKLQVEKTVMQLKSSLKKDGEGEGKDEYNYSKVK